jgi:hypothetical protein
MMLVKQLRNGSAPIVVILIHGQPVCAAQLTILLLDVVLGDRLYMSDKEKNMKKFVVTLLLLVTLLVSACTVSNQAPPPASDNGDASWELVNGVAPTAPVDDTIYSIDGKVVAGIESLTRQVSPAQGSVSGYSINGVGGMSGYYTGPVINGKSFVRILISTIDPPSKLADIGQIVILKVLDTKATALLPGDIVSLKCRAQYEAVAPIRVRETFDPEKYATWEFDFCRLVTPAIHVVVK